MSSLDVRNNSAVMKRAEQLKRWEESDTNREPSSPRPENGRRIKFSSGCVFLAACLAGDKEEVIKLLDSGADINTANVDGLTALHQACIDDNLEMVEFLVEHGADINRQDNEGWTPLHATASCGFVSIARYLVEHGADVAAVNSDGDLAVDLAVDIQHLGMIDFMQKMVAEHSIDCEKARQAEEQQMLNDAKRWLRSDASEVDRPHPKTGATALHVAAAKGYTKVLSLLLAGRANVDKQDNDGWTPLHAASHWSQKEAAEMLVDAMADMDVRNYAGQCCIDVAERKMVKFLEELRTNNKRLKRRPSSQINSRISETIENHIDNASNKIIRVEVRPDQSKDQSNVAQHLVTLESDNSYGDDGVDDSSTVDVDGGESDGGTHHKLNIVIESDETDSELTDSTESSHSTSISEAEDDKSKPATETVTGQSQQQQSSNDDDAPWRRNSLATRTRTPPESPAKNQVPDNDVKSTTTSAEATDVILRRTQSFENDEKFYQKYNELRARIKANSCPILPASLTNNNPSALGTVNTTNQNYSVQRSASLKDHRNFRKPTIATTTTMDSTSTSASPTTTNALTKTSTITTSTSATTITTPVRSDQNSPPRATENTPILSPNTANNQSNNNNKLTTAPSNGGSSKAIKQSAGNILKNFFKSFVPPVRDEESETQRKAHAKRVRETRRSTQGVTLDEIKSAEELVKKKNSSMASSSNTTGNSSSNDTQTSTTSITTSQVLRAPETDTTSPTPTTLPMKGAVEMVDTTATTTPTDQTIPTSSPNDALEKSEDIVDDNDDDDITATFTIVTPTVKHRFPANTEHDELEEISATFTITSRHESRTPTPTSESYTTIETTITVTPPEITIEAPQDEKNDGDGDGDADVDVEAMTEEEIKSVEVQLKELCASNDSSPLDCASPKANEKNETESLEKLTQTATPTVLGVALKAEEPKINSGTSSESEAPIRGTTLSPIPPQPVLSCVVEPTPNPTLDSPVRMREKRSIFDPDNMNSLSLAEKLRNEANKYNDDRNFTAISDQAASDSDRDSVFSNYSRRSLDSSPLHMGSGGGVGGGASSTERRPSWRLKFDAGCKFKLEDASSGTTFPPTNSTIIPSAPAVIAAANLSSSVGQRRINSTGNAINSSTQSLNSVGRPLSAPTTVNAASSFTNVGDNQHNDRFSDCASGSFTTRRLNAMTSTTSMPTASNTPLNTITASSSITTAHLASSLSKSSEDKENDKENDSRSSAATQAVLQRRRKPKRRSTGVVHLDMDDLDLERQEMNAENDERESGNERSSRSRIGSTASSTTADNNRSRVRSENGGELIDYKALWEAAKLENEKLKQLLKKKDDEVVQSKATLERFTNATTKNSLSEIEKRERRAMERKLSEMEEELKQLEVFKTENQRLKEENGALIRVISKLSK